MAYQTLIEVTSPGKKFAAAATSVVSNAFTPPAGSLIVVLAAHAGNTNAITVTSSDSAVWTAAVQLGASVAQSAIYYTYYGSSPGSITVTSAATSGTNTYQDIRVVTGSSPLPVGGTATLAVNFDFAFSKSITTAAANSFVYGIALNTSNDSMSVVSGFTSLNTQSGSGAFVASGRRSVVSPSSVTVGWSCGFADSGPIAFAEFQPALLAPPLKSANFVPLLRSSTR